MLLFVAFLVAALSVAYLSGLSRLFSVSALRHDVERFGPWAYVLYVGGYALLVAMGFPSSVLTVSGALAFGTWPNTGLAVLGSTLGAGAAFLVARFLARGWVKARLRRRGRQMDRWIGRRGVEAIFILRLMPIVPFNVVNFASGLTRVPFWPYTWATAAGSAPGIFAYSFITNRAVEVDFARPETFFEPQMLAAIALALFLSLAVPLLWRLYDRRRGPRP